MSFEYIETVEQTNYTVTGATDEAYPEWNAFSMYSKTEKVKYNSKIYKARQTISLPTYYVYNKSEKSLYIPSTAIFASTAIFKPLSTFENRYIYLDDTDVLYKYIGSIEITVDPFTIDFTDTSKWQNLGVQLNGYAILIAYPDLSPLYWEDLGAVNSKKAFDNTNSSQTISDEDTNLIYTFETGNVDRIALFNLSAKEIIIKTHLGTGAESPENTVEETITLYSQIGDNFYDILYSPIVFNKTQYISIPIAGTQTITITFVPENYAKVGDITLGKAKTIGATLDSVNFDIKDYSTYGSDAGASNSYVEGGYRKVNDFTISFNTIDMNNVLDALESLRGKVVVFNLDNRQDKDYLKLKGFMRSRPLNYISNSKKSKINIKLEGRLE